MKAIVFARDMSQWSEWCRQNGHDRSQFKYATRSTISAWVPNPEIKEFYLDGWEENKDFYFLKLIKEREQMRVEPTSNELLPCPFCGCPIKDQGEGFYYHPRHLTCWLSMFEMDNMTPEIWNTRHIQPPAETTNGRKEV